jgi:hypothetical protein
MKKSHTTKSPPKKWALIYFLNEPHKYDLQKQKVYCLGAGVAAGATCTAGAVA